MTRKLRRKRRKLRRKKRREKGRKERLSTWGCWRRLSQER